MALLINCVAAVSKRGRCFADAKAALCYIGRMPAWIILVAVLTIAATAALTWLFWRTDPEHRPQRKP
jgi:hypothetical protein